MADENRESELDLFPQSTARNKSDPAAEARLRPPETHNLLVTFDYGHSRILLNWSLSASSAPVAGMRIRCTGLDVLNWELNHGTKSEIDESSHHRMSIRSRLRRLKIRFPLSDTGVTAGMIPSEERRERILAGSFHPVAVPDWMSVWNWLEGQILSMAGQSRAQFSPISGVLDEIDPHTRAFLEKEERKEKKKEQELKAKRALIEANQRRFEAARRKRALARQERAAKQQAQAAASPTPASTQPAQRPLPEVSARIDFPALQFQPSLLPVPDLRSFFLLERAASWWVSNQSDDLLGLP